MLTPFAWLYVTRAISNAEKRGKRQVLIRPSSKVIVKFLQVMMKHGACTPAPAAWGGGNLCRPQWRWPSWAGLAMVHRLTGVRVCAGYIGEFEIVDDHRAGKIVVQLLGEFRRALFHAGL